MKQEIVFEGAIEGYVRKYISKNIWKLDRLYTNEDLYQESYRIFLELKIRYDQVDTPAWFMSLYKRSLATWWIDQAKRNSKVRKEFTETSLPIDSYKTSEDLFNLDQQSSCSNEGNLAVLISEAPPEIVEVLILIFDTPKEVMDIAIKEWKSSGRKKIMGNNFLCNLLGRDPLRKNVVKEINDYFLV